MRKLIGLLFLTATLIATSAHAQGIFIDRGDPSVISATAGGRYVMTDSSWGGSVSGGWSYRGVFDVGADITYFKYQSDPLKKLAGISATPFLAWHVMRGEEEELPLSISLTLGVTREFFTGNDPVANPEGWGLFAGPSVYRKIEIGTSMLFVPEILAAYDLKATRTYSSARDQPSGSRDLSGASGYATEMKHRPRVLLKLNMLFKTRSNSKFTFTPYAGYQGGVAGGAMVGALF
jgi:hypothetical protein